MESRPEDPNVLLSREAAGMLVEVWWLKMLDRVAVRVTYDGRSCGHTVPKDKVMDAFHHPMRYLAESQIVTLAVS